MADLAGDVSQREPMRAAPWRATQPTYTDALDAYTALSTAVDRARGDHEELGEGQRGSERLPMRMAV